MPKITTSGSRLDAREVVVVGDGRNTEKNHLQLAFKCEGGGGGGRRVETAEKNHLRLTFGREGGWWWESCQNDEKNHLQLAFGCEGGGGGGSRVETTKRTTSGSHLDARKVVVVAVASK